MLSVPPRLKTSSRAVVLKNPGDARSRRTFAFFGRNDGKNRRGGGTWKLGRRLSFEQEADGDHIWVGSINPVLLTLLPGPLPGPLSLMKEQQNSLTQSKVNNYVGP